jgi:cbb3-type cytochrome oxidase subunit 3
MRFEEENGFRLMLCCYKYISFAVIFAVIFCFSPINNALSLTIPAPTIVAVDISGTNLDEPSISGLTQSGTNIMIYIDGQYVGEANINHKDTATDSFYFKVIDSLDAGQHTVMAIAKDSTSLVLSPPSIEAVFYIKPLPAPTLIQPNESAVTGKIKPLITGLTASNSFVHIFIDGIYNGKTQNLTHESGTANFAYKPFLNLSVGPHTVWAMTEDENGRKSQPSNLLNFNIEEPMPAPILFTPVVNNRTVYNQPFIVGLAKNDSLIKVYIDQQLDGQFRAENHQSGVANFAYKPFLPLTNGKHMVYTEAIDSRGKVSCWSNIVYFEIVRSIQPAITKEAAEETAAVEVLPEILESEEEAKPVQEEVKEEKTGEEVSKIEELLQEPEEEATGETGLIDESREQQGKLKWNLIIFILFLVAVIAWIFWVNRELIKERREKNKEEKNKTIVSKDKK